MAAPPPETRPPQAAPQPPLPPYRLHSGEFALYQSNHLAALFPKFPSVTCLGQRNGRRDKQAEFIEPTLNLLKKKGV